MGTNFAFILYKCGGSASDFRVKVLQNEKETIVQGCSELYCPLETFVEAYFDYLVGEFDTLCENKKANTQVTCGRLAQNLLIFVEAPRKKKFNNN